MVNSFQEITLKIIIRWWGMPAVWELRVGRPITGSALLPESQALAPFVALCRDDWQASSELVNEYRRRQAERDQGQKP